ncbi:hypothetical protein EV175_002356 [Coemansia sp. RSA 1933]|nr:hypothetical protein EV175_002356 [Coemansia sp. RSA 1933]
MKSNAGTNVHNPLLHILGKKGEVTSAPNNDAEANENAEILKKYGPTFPLSPVHTYILEKDRFLLMHRGIAKTPTRYFHGLENPGDTINLKHAFGHVAVFRKILHTGRALKNDNRDYPNEFMFAKPQNTHVYYMNHLTLYIHALHMLRETEKDTFRRSLDDFFLIIKSIRQRSAIHIKLVDMFEFKKLVLAYIVFAKQSLIAVTMAINLFPNVLPEVLDRWLVTGVMELHTLQEIDKSNAKVLESYRKTVKEHKDSVNGFENMSRVQKRKAKVIPGPTAIKEIRTEFLVSAIIDYYQSDPNIVMTGWEVVHLISLAKNRLGANGLKAIIPHVLKYYYQDSPTAYSAVNKAAFFYDWWVWMYKIDGFQAALCYIKAFDDIGEHGMARSIAETVESMPPKTIEGLVGTSSEIIGAFKKLFAECNGFDELRKEVYCAFGVDTITKRNKEDEGKPKYAKLKLALAEKIVKFVRTGDKMGADATTAMLGSLSRRMQPLTVMAIARRLDSSNMNHATEWITRSFYGFDKEAQKSAFAWLTDNLVKSRDGYSRFISDYSFKDPVTVAQLVNLLSRQLVNDADRRFILGEARKHVLSTGNAVAIGSLLVTASKGHNVPALSSFGLQSPTSCAQMVTKFVKSIKPKPNMNVAALVPFLFKVAQLLNSQRLEHMLWKLVLRHGIEVDQQMMKLSLGVRLGNGDRNEDTLELLHSALCLESELEDTSQDENPLLESDASNSHFGSGGLAALYMTILNGANHVGSLEAVELLAKFMLKNKELSNRSFGSLASIWLDAAGFSENSSRDEVQRVWNIVVSHVGPSAAAKHKREEFHINRNHYHSAIEAFIRQGDMESAWNMIQVEMRKALIRPDLKTFYTLTSPLASNSQLWSIGKTMVQRFNAAHPEIVKAALSDRSNTPIVQALLRMSLKEEKEETNAK